MASSRSHPLHKAARALNLGFLEINLTSPDSRWPQRNAASFKGFLESLEIDTVQKATGNLVCVGQQVVVVQMLASRKISWELVVSQPPDKCVTLGKLLGLPVYFLTCTY